MKPKKLSNTFRNSEHGEKAEPLVAGGQEIKMKGVLEEQESYYLQSSHLFKFDGADLEKPEAPFRASKQIMEQLQQDQAAQDWYAQRPGFGGDPDNTAVPEFYQELMTALGPWMEGGAQALFFPLGYSQGLPGAAGNFHNEWWRIKRETREFTLQQLFDFDGDGVSLGTDPFVQDWLYNYFIELGTTDEGESLNSWLQPEDITPFMLHGISHHMSSDNPNYSGTEQMEFLGPNGETIVNSSGNDVGPTGWVNAWFEGPGTQYALDNNWDWPTSVDPFGIWEQYANSTTSLPSSPIVVMETGIQIIAQIIQYSTGTSDLSLFPDDLSTEFDYQSLGYDTLFDYYDDNFSLFTQTGIGVYYENLASGGTGYPQQQMGGFIYPHAFQEFLDTMGIDFNVGVFEGYGASNSNNNAIDGFFSGDGFEEYTTLLEIFNDYHNNGTTPQGGPPTDNYFASYLQAYLGSNGEYGWQNQLGNFMDWYATGVNGGFIELSEAAQDTFEQAYEAYVDGDSTFNWFWFDFSQELGSDEFLNMQTYEMYGNNPDWGQAQGGDGSQGSGANYNDGGGNSPFAFDPQTDINFVTDSEGYLEAFPIPEIAEGGIPEWYTFLVSTAQTWNSEYSTQYTGHSGMFYNIAAHTLDTIFDYDGDGNTTGTEIQDLADMGYPIGEMIINHFQGLLDEAGGGETLSITGNDLTAQLLAMNSYDSSQPWNGGNAAGGQSAGLVFDALYEAAPELQQFNTSQLIGWICNWGNSLSWAPDGTGTSIFNSSWHADFFNGSAYGQANGGNGMPAALDPMGLWAYNTTGEGTSNGWEMGGNTTGYYGFVTQYTMMEMFNWWGNQGMNTQSDEGLWGGGGNMFANNEGWSVSSGLPSGWFWLTAVNYMNGYNDTGQEGIWEPFYDFLESEGYNEEYYQDLQEYQLDNPADWQELDSYYSLLHQYFSLAPGNPLMEANFFADQLAITDWYIQGVVGMGVAENPDSWNGPLLDEMSEVAIQNFQNALDSGSFWFDFTYDITDDNFLFSTNQDGPFWAEGFDASGWGDDLTNTVPEINPSIGMENLLGENAILNLPNWVANHGGLIDYNGDGRVDMGDFLEFISWTLGSSDAGVEMYGLTDLSVLIEYGLFDNSLDSAIGLAEGFNLNVISGITDISGGANWLFSPINTELVPGYLFNYQNTEASIDSYEGGIAALSAGSAEPGAFSYGSLITTFLIFQFVNDFVDSGGVTPAWYNFILGEEVDTGQFGPQFEVEGQMEGFDFTNGGINTLLDAVYPQWSEWSEATGLDFGGENVNTTVLALVGLIEALLPPPEVMTNYAYYYLFNGIDINQQFVNADGSTVDVVSGGNSLTGGLDAELFAASQQNYTFNLVSNNAEYFASLDVNQDGQYDAQDAQIIEYALALLNQIGAQTFYVGTGYVGQSSGDYDVIDIRLYLIEIFTNFDPDQIITASGANFTQVLNTLLEFSGAAPEASPGNNVTTFSTALTEIISTVWGAVLSVSAGEYVLDGTALIAQNPGVIVGSPMISNLVNEFNNFILDSVLGTILENTDGSYYTDAEGNQIPFSFTAAGLQALASQGSSFLGGFGSEGPNEGLLSNIEESIASLTEEGLSIDFNGDGVYDINDINILLSIASEGPNSPEEAMIAELLNVSTHPDTLDFDTVDIMFLVQWLGLPGETDLVFPAVGVFGETTETPFASYNMFGYFNDDGTWVDFGYDDVTPDDYFGPGWSATQTNNNETTS